MTFPLVSVIILNYNGKAWLTKCIESLARQSIRNRIQVIVADNASSDDSAELAQKLLQSLNNESRVVENGGNLGYCEGNNRGAKAAAGKYLLFLNTDTWLEDDCLERLLAQVEAMNADSASPMVLEYDSDTFQGNGASGFDLFGYLTNKPTPLPAGTIFAAPGCSLLVRKDVFERVGGFDPELFMYSDEADLAWRLALSGAVTITVPEARVHHRGAAAANPKGGERVVEFRTNEMVRFFATRNALLVIFKNAQSILLLLAVAQICWVILEIFTVLLLSRRWGPVKNAYIRALGDLWRLRPHLVAERKRIKELRRHGDFWMLRFMRLRPGRWVDIQKLFRLGAPKVSPSRF